MVQIRDQSGQPSRPKQEPSSKEDTASIPIPGTPFRLSAEGRLLVAVDLQELLTNQGIPRNLAGRLVAQKDPEAVAKVLLNALYLQSQGKLQNGAGYIRAGIEDGYDLLPQVASRLEGRRRELEAQLRTTESRQHQNRQANQNAAEEAAMSYVLEQLGPEQGGPVGRAGDRRSSGTPGSPQPHAFQPLRTRQGLRAGLRRAARLSLPAGSPRTAPASFLVRIVAWRGSHVILAGAIMAACICGQGRPLSLLWDIFSCARTFARPMSAGAGQRVCQDAVHIRDNRWVFIPDMQWPAGDQEIAHLP